MEKRFNKKALIFSLIFALISCFLVFNYIRGIQKPEKEEVMVKLLVASRSINPGEEIKPGDINAVDIPEASLPAGIVNDRKNIEGLYAREKIIIGEPFRSERMSKAEELALSFNIPEGMRALSIYVNENTILSNQLRVGDRVDVIGNFKEKIDEEKEIAYSKIIIQDIEVLSIGPSRIRNNSDNQTTNSGESELPRTITLCVTPGDAEKMAFTSAFADFTIALRGRGDDKKVNSPGALIDTVAPINRID